MADSLLQFGFAEGETKCFTFPRQSVSGDCPHNSDSLPCPHMLELQFVLAGNTLHLSVVSP